MPDSKIKNYLNKNINNHSAKIVDMLISISEHPEPLSVDAINDIAKYTFSCSKPSKGMFKAVRLHLFGGETTSIRALEYGRLLINENTNPDTVIQLLNTSTKIKTHIDNKLLSKNLKLLLKHYNLKRVSGLLWGHHTNLLKDTVNMMESIFKEHPTLNFLPKKPKTILDIHDSCVRALPKINIANFDLEQREDILLLDKKKLNDELFIRVPKTHFDLVDLGEDLNFCIGNGTYSRNVKNKKSSIVGIFNKKGPVLGIEFTRYTIKQAHGFGNRPELKPSKELLNLLHEALTEKPKLPNDFLPVERSFIKGYRYDNDNLYLMLGTKVYIYFNVPVDIYEDLLESESKGTYLNRYIKGSYEYENLGDVGSF